MSFLSIWNEINTLGSFILGGGVSHRQIILSCDGERFVVPVTPKTYKVETEQNNRVVDILDTGEAQLFGNRKLKRLSFSCFFPQPSHAYPFVVGDDRSPSECVELLEKWKEGKKAVRVIITDSPVNLMMAIKSFDYREQDGSRDIYYELKFIEWRDLNTPLANNEKQVEKLTGLKKRPVGTTIPPRPSSIQRARDILDASRKAYGKYKYWRSLRDKNNLKYLALKNLRQIVVDKEQKKS
ncbi:hypothetical protein [Mitsuokella jalaludinii]|uniref:hypothetical protein n=1 Tax=Mitsuokella jalaludinii TaxID=187979 RepID=UPI001D01D958|nr:hypothetical protein [Mitsuokella jalaludinii]MCB5725951.1 hypothetical protein [Mitsuokella jalaludinii]